MTEPRSCHTADGLKLEAEYRPAAGAPRTGVVLCHAHPQYGGSMRDMVTGALFEALPALGCSCLRFNFRGVDGSEGSWAEGIDEPLDVVAAIDVLATEVGATVPLALTGWSFGADMALSVIDPRIAGWLGVAPPLRFRAKFPAANDIRPKHLVLAEHDEMRSSREVEAAVATWTATTTEIVSGASHFFVGRNDRVIAAADGFLRKLA